MAGCSLRAILKVLNKRRELGEIGQGEVDKIKTYLEKTKPWDNRLGLPYYRRNGYGD
jgi:hypothetical protein